MSHFSKSGIENDPDGHARLKEILHGRNVRARTGGFTHVKPSLESRFGTGGDERDAAAPAPQLVRIDDKVR